ERIMPKQTAPRQIPIKEARRILLEQETEALIDRQAVTERAVELAENQGIIFLDELDKICGPQSTHGPDVPRQGVQRDLLPVADIAFEVNRTTQNIGARRLHTILERVVEQVCFEGPDLPDKRVVINGEYVRERLGEILQKEDLSRFIL